MVEARLVLSWSFDANAEKTCPGIMVGKIIAGLLLAFKRWLDKDMAVGQSHWYHFGVGAPPILEHILVGIGMFTGGTGF